MSEPLPAQLTCTLAVTRYARAARMIRMIHHHNAHVVVAILRTVAMAETHHTHPDPVTRAAHHRAYHPNRYRSPLMSEPEFTVGQRVTYAAYERATRKHGVVVRQEPINDHSIFVRFDGDLSAKAVPRTMLTLETT